MLTPITIYRITGGKDIPSLQAELARAKTATERRGIRAAIEQLKDHDE